MEIFTSNILTDYVYLHPTEIHSKYKDMVLMKLKEKLEGKCSKYGYICQNSIEIVKISPGNIRMTSLNGDIIYHVQFKADVCNPVVGAIIKAKITNVNKFGILATASIQIINSDGNEERVNVIEIIITKNSVGIKSSVDLDRLVIGHEIDVEILGKKFEINDTKISSIGVVIDKTKKKTSHGIGSIEEDVTAEDDVEEEEVSVLEGLPVEVEEMGSDAEIESEVEEEIDEEEIEDIMKEDEDDELLDGGDDLDLIDSDVEVGGDFSDDNDDEL
jgi:DNA-directed RNA polymerase subunit E'/Rpb7